MLHDLRGSVLSLQDICVQYLVKNVDAVESFGGEDVFTLEKRIR